MTTSQTPAKPPVHYSPTSDEELAPDKPAGTDGKPRNTAVLAAVFALGCLACLLPGLLAGGALAATFGALGADEIVFGALAIAAIAAIAVVLVRRSRRVAAGSDGCGC